ncbi:D-alanine-D-alanine ligase [Thermoactinomyces sp. DSM 45891]|uniref:D-alanine--D-alanine ligase family protein n=1 Tax=Thermoactinomyces sp. DSM 45891 TaxID=1761907 RepID=UPI00091F9A6A|nr:D-alanine--D-alanine ligase family protein [Thermoactinomyces sp. DSM 45891]SFX51589.1 D-alanine-D-alanine ligase [Thermoactinomyces sp. DSM 45891]
MNTQVYVLYGGKSVEHEISKRTALAIINALDKEKYDVYSIYINNEGIWCNTGKVTEELKELREGEVDVDMTPTLSLATVLQECFSPGREHVVIPALHGTYGEDGTIQGLLELIDVPYIGNGIMPSAIGIDKAMTKEIFSKVGIPQAEYVFFTIQEWKRRANQIFEQIEDGIGYPCFVKPAKLGSSVGVHRCQNRDELIEALKDAFTFDQKVVVDKEVIGREMQIAVIGNENPECSVAGEYILEKSFMDYNAKYVDGKLIPVIPANIPDSLHTKMQEISQQAFQVLNGSGLMRVDFFVTEENDLYVNEVNTFPGFTGHSMFPALWEATKGMTYPEIIEKFIDLAIERHQNSGQIQYTRG